MGGFLRPKPTISVVDIPPVFSSNCQSIAAALGRSKYLHLNDPRCYNGAYFDAEHRWGQWEVLDRLPTQERADRAVAYWVDMNDYAVSQRGDSAKREFKIEVKEKRNG